MPATVSGTEYTIMREIDENPFPYKAYFLVSVGKTTSFNTTNM